MNYKKALKVIFVDFLGLLVGVLSGFILPKVFTIDSYSFYKTFGLYASYAGIFHLGFSDGIYILYGGKNKDDIDITKTRGYFKALLKIDFGVFFFFLIISIMLAKKDVALIYFSMYILPFQIVHFFRLYYRAIGEFNKYSLLQGIVTFFNLLGILLVIFACSSPKVLIAFQIVTLFIMALVIVCKFGIIHNYKSNIPNKQIYSICKMGFVIMIANTFCSLFFTLDRWFVKFQFTTNDFAYYSFATSMLNVFLVLVNSMTMLYYPYFSRNISNIKAITKIKKYTIIITSLVPSGYYILEFIVKRFLDKYIMSLEILQILIINIPFICVINMLYANLYKASKKGRRYFQVVIKMFFVSLILNMLAILIFKNINSIAYATLISFFIWYLYSAKDFKGLEIDLKEVAFFIVYIVIFMYIKSLKLNPMISFTLFNGCMLVNIFLFYRFCKDFK